MEAETNESGSNFMSVLMTAVVATLGALVTASGLKYLSNLFLEKPIKSIGELYASVVDTYGNTVPQKKLQKFLKANPHALQELLHACEAQLKLIADTKENDDLRRKVSNLRDNCERVWHETQAEEHTKAAKSVGREDSEEILFAATEAA